MKIENSVTFDLKTKLGRKSLLDFVKNLMDYNESDNSLDQGNYFDILIKYEDCGIYTVNFIQQYGGDHAESNCSFVCAGPDEFLAKEIRLPDKTYVTVPADQDEDSYITEWVEATCPGRYAKNMYDQWYDVEEQKAWEKQLAKAEKREKQLEKSKKEDK